MAKAEITPDCDHLDLLTTTEEQELIYLLYRFNIVVQLAASSLKPSLIATHLYTMTKTFSRFYTEHSILQAETKELTAARLMLVSCFKQVLKTGLNLLGIDPPEQM